MDKKDAHLLVHHLVDISIEFPSVQEDILLLCDRLEGGCLSEDELREWQQCPFFEDVFVVLYRRLGIHFLKVKRK